MRTVNDIYSEKVAHIQSRLEGYAQRLGLESPAFTNVLVQAQDSLTQQTQDSEVADILAQNALTIADAKSAPTASFSGSMATYESLVNQISAKYGMDAKLIKALIQVESGFNASAVSGAGAQGLMQLMPGTARSLGVTNSFDPAQNIEGGVKYLSQMLDRFGDIRLALAAYNAGPGSIGSLGVTDANNATEYSRISSGVRGYVSKVLNHYQSLITG